VSSYCLLAATKRGVNRAEYTKSFVTFIMAYRQSGSHNFFGRGKGIWWKDFRFYACCLSKMSKCASDSRLYTHHCRA